MFSEPSLYKFPGLQAALLLLLAISGLSCSAGDARKEPSQHGGQGKRLFEAHCARCHGMAGGGGTGATLTRPRLLYAVDKQALSDIILNGIAGTGMPGSWLSHAEVGELAGYVLSLGAKPEEPILGDSGRGPAAYRKGLCHTCHIINGQGTGVGPELTEIGTRRGRQYLRQAVLHPGIDMPSDSDGFKASLVVTAVTTEGVEIRGQRINEDSFTIQLKDVGNRLYSFRKSELKALKKEVGVSLMPSFEGILSASETDDLIAYLANLGVRQ